jgi:hypothetical protein
LEKRIDKIRDSDVKDNEGKYERELREQIERLQLQTKGEKGKRA